MGEQRSLISDELLLESADPASSICKTLAGILRKTVQKSFATHESAFVDAIKSLDANEVWKKVTPAEQSAINGIVKLTLSERTYRVELTSFALIGRHRLPPARR